MDVARNGCATMKQKNTTVSWTLKSVDPIAKTDYIDYALAPVTVKQCGLRLFKVHMHFTIEFRSMLFYFKFVVAFSSVMIV